MINTVKDSDFERCKGVVCVVMKNKNIDQKYYDLDSVTKEIMGISDAKGGSFSNDMIYGFANGYFDSNLHARFDSRNLK